MQKEAFTQRPLESVTKLWVNQVKTNEEQFNKRVTDLQSYELTLIKALADIEKVEVNSI